MHLLFLSGEKKYTGYNKTQSEKSSRQVQGNWFTVFFSTLSHIVSYPEHFSPIENSFLIFLILGTTVNKDLGFVVPSKDSTGIGNYDGGRF